MLGCWGRRFSVTTIELCHCSVKAATDSTYTDGHGGLSIVFNSWALKFEFHMLFVS